MSRIIPPLASFFNTSAQTPLEKITSVEGVHEPGGVDVKVMQAGEDILVLEVFRKKGAVDPTHRHDDHESCGYLITGKMRLIIGGEEFIAGPGTSWRHPRGVDHFSEALEDCYQIEIKSPPCRTWKSD